MAEEIAQLVAELRNFRTRSAASKKLAAGGLRAVQPLLDALQSEAQEGAKWSIIKCLGDLGAMESVQQLAPYLDEPHYGTVSHEALVKITGQDFGPVPEAWLRWLKSRQQEQAEPSAPAPEPGLQQEIPDERLVELALTDTGAECREAGPGQYKVTVSCKNGTTQDVAVVFNIKDHEGAKIVVVYSDCGPASADQYETALRRNLKMPYGAMAIRDVGGQPTFVMFNTILRQDLSPVELRKSILSVGERAEQMKKQLLEGGGQ